MLDAPNCNALACLAGRDCLAVLRRACVAFLVDAPNGDFLIEKACLGNMCLDFLPAAVKVCSVNAGGCSGARPNHESAFSLSGSDEPFQPSVAGQVHRSTGYTVSSTSHLCSS